MTDFFIEQLAGDEIPGRDMTLSLPQPTIGSGPGCAFERRTIPTIGMNTWTTSFGPPSRASWVSRSTAPDAMTTSLTRSRGWTITGRWRCCSATWTTITRWRRLSRSPNTKNPRKELEEQIRPLARKISLIEAPYRRAAFEKKLAKFPEEIQIAVKTPDQERTAGPEIDCRTDPVARCGSRHRRQSERGAFQVSPADQGKRRGSTKPGRN